MATQKVAHAVAGAVPVGHALLPQRHAGQHVELHASGAHGEFGAGQRQVALEHQGEVVALLRRGLAQGDGAGDVGGAVEILAAGVDEQQSAGLQARRALDRGLIVNYGAMLLVAGYHAKAVAAIHVILCALALQAAVHIELGHDLGGGHAALEPHHHARQRRAVALHGAARAGYLHIVFNGLQRHYGRGGIHLAAHYGLGQRVAHAVGVDEHHLALGALLKESLHIVVGAHAHVVGLEVGAHFGSELAVVDEEHALALRHIGEGYHHRGVGHIGAAQVKEPRNLVERGHKGAGGPGLLHRLHSAVDFAVNRLASQVFAVHIGLGSRPLGAVGPDFVGGIEVGGKHKAVFGAEVFEAVGRHHRKQASVDGHNAVFVEFRRQPLGDGGLAGNVLLMHFKSAVLELLGSLQKIARIGPQPGLVERDHGGAVAAGEAGEPVAELPVGAHIFALVRVGAGHNHGIHVFCTHGHAHGLEVR